MGREEEEVAVVLVVVTAEKREGSGQEEQEPWGHTTHFRPHPLFFIVANVQHKQ